MQAAEAHRAEAPADAQLRFRGAAFGLGVFADREIAVAPAATPPGRIVTCTTVPRAAVERATAGVDRETLVHLQHPDGRTFMRIERLADAGYEVRAPGHGTHLVAADGTTIASAVPARRRLLQTLFFAQALPLAAALQGLEPMHASAVEVGGRAVVFTASSGTGKSTVAAHAVALGAGFVADDVVALELDGDAVLAHPGPARASIAPHDAVVLGARLGRLVPEGDKLLARPVPAPGPLPLGLVVRLVRGAGRPGLRASSAPLGRTLLASAFLAYLRTPERLVHQLAVHSAVAATVPVVELELAGPPQTAAELVLRHAERLR
jgi:hypothetical protein